MKNIKLLDDAIENIHKMNEDMTDLTNEVTTELKHLKNTLQESKKTTHTFLVITEDKHMIETITLCGKHDEISCMFQEPPYVRENNCFEQKEYQIDAKLVSIGQILICGVNRGGDGEIYPEGYRLNKWHFKYKEFHNIDEAVAYSKSIKGEGKNERN